MKCKACDRDKFRKENPHAIMNLCAYAHTCDQGDVMDERKIIDKAIDMLIRYGGVDGAHHKDYAIDQALRILCGPRYEEIIKESCNGEDGPNTYAHNIGIPP